MMMMMISFARAIVANPELLILDEEILVLHHRQLRERRTRRTLLVERVSYDRSHRVQAGVAELVPSESSNASQSGA